MLKDGIEYLCDYIRENNIKSILEIGSAIGYSSIKMALVDSDINFIYYLQLFVNALWSIFFFVLEWTSFAFLWILLLLALVIIMTIRFYNKNKIAGLIQIPYLLWVTFATYLNFAIWFLNN